MPTTGKQLKLERVAKDVPAGQLAARMKVARQTVWIIEKSATVSDEQAKDYRTALATFENVATDAA